MLDCLSHYMRCSMSECEKPFRILFCEEFHSGPIHDRITKIGQFAINFSYNGLFPQAVGDSFCSFGKCNIAFKLLFLSIFQMNCNHNNFTLSIKSVSGYIQQNKKLPSRKGRKVYSVVPPKLKPKLHSDI